MFSVWKLAEITITDNCSVMSFRSLTTRRFESISHSFPEFTRDIYFEHNSRKKSLIFRPKCAMNKMVLLFNFHTLYEFRFFGWLICAT